MCEVEGREEEGEGTREKVGEAVGRAKSRMRMWRGEESEYCEVSADVTAAEEEEAPSPARLSSQRVVRRGSGVRLYTTTGDAWGALGSVEAMSTIQMGLVG